MKQLYIALILTVFTIDAVYWCVQAYTEPGPLVAEKTLIFKKGTGFSGISAQLEAEGVVAHPLYFKAVAAASGKAARFKAGEYAFPAHVSMKDVITMLAGGKVVIHKLTVAEGLNVREVSALIAAEPALADPVPGDIAEGSLLPETYYFTYGDTRADLVGRMQKAMRETLNTLWDKRKPGLPLASPHDALVLASIVEKETGLKDERGHVASVYINRLRKNMLLQADPTVAYGIERALGGPLKHPLTLSDLQTPSPYNTYLNAGLPPTPIANPGKDAIAATLNPPETNDIYFVATGTGGHHFAATMKEHAKNVAEYRKAQREAKKN